MCGICGVIQTGGDLRSVVAPEVLDRMTDLMTHRGPNDRGTHLAAGVALGARRLSIVDLAGAPPARDRKSTRLNSSHSQISYAVFCLKKKNDSDVLIESIDQPQRD